MRTGNRLGNTAQGPIVSADVVEAVFTHNDGMGAVVPFANELDTGFEAKGRLQRGMTFGLKLSREDAKLTFRRRAEPALRVFLNLVGNAADEQIATQTDRRLDAISFPPSDPQFPCRHAGQRSKRFSDVRHLAVLRRCGSG